MATIPQVTAAWERAGVGAGTGAAARTTGIGHAEFALARFCFTPVARPAVLPPSSSLRWSPEDSDPQLIISGLSVTRKGSASSYPLAMAPAAAALGAAMGLFVYVEKLPPTSDAFSFGVAGALCAIPRSGSKGVGNEKYDGFFVDSVKWPMRLAETRTKINSR